MWPIEPTEKKKRFVENIARLHPTLKVVGDYNGQLCYVTIEDELGILYKVRPSNLMAGWKPNIIYSAIDKTQAFKIKLAKMQPELKVKVKGEFKGTQTKILVEDENNIEYLCLPNTLLQGSPPSIRTAVDKNKAFEIKARLIHGDKYDYSQAEYKGKGYKIKINCPIHGVFMQSASSHLCIRCGCPKCGNKKQGTQVRYNIFSRSNWIKYCMDTKKQPYMYIIKCYDEKEQFVKIGITGNKLANRMCPSNLPYKYKEIGRVVGEPAFVFDMEKTLHDKYKDYKHIPLKKFGGSLECFSIKVLDEIYWKQSELWS